MNEWMKAWIVPMVVIFRSNIHYTKGIEVRIIDRKINFYNKAKSRAWNFIRIC